MSVAGSVSTNVDFVVNAGYFIAGLATLEFERRGCKRRDTVFDLPAKLMSLSKGASIWPLAVMIIGVFFYDPLFQSIILHHKEILGLGSALGVLALWEADSRVFNHKRT